MQKANPLHRLTHIWDSECDTKLFTMKRRTKTMLSNYCLAIFLLGMMFSLAGAMSREVAFTLWALGFSVLGLIPAWLLSE